MSRQTLSVMLPSEVIYVSGTVNSEAVTWTRMGEAWEASADRAADDIYHVALTAIDAAGNATDANMTLYYGVLHLITDRTAGDVARWEYLRSLRWEQMTDTERAEWLTDLRGAYNATDLNRVASAAEYIAGRFTDAGYIVTIHPKKDWAAQDIPNTEDMAKYLADIETLRTIAAVLDTTPKTPPDMDKLTWQEANNIEQILLDVNLILDLMAASWWYSGEIYSGEV